jgi:hypothetical protein
MEHSGILFGEKIIRNVFDEINVNSVISLSFHARCQL